VTALPTSDSSSHDYRSELELDARSGEAYSVAARLAAEATEPPAVPLEFDPNNSYGQTRSMFEAQFERRYVSWLLTRHSGNISAAAREARMDRKHLHDLAKKHGLRGRGPAGSRS